MEKLPLSRPSQLFLGGFDGVPIGLFFSLEHVRMAEEHFFANLGNYVLHGKGPLFLGNDGVEDDLKQEIAQLFLEGGVVGIVDGLHYLCRLVDKARAERLVGLLGIPIASLGGAEDGNEGGEILYGKAGLSAQAGFFGGYIHRFIHFLLLLWLVHQPIVIAKLSHRPADGAVDLGIAKAADGVGNLMIIGFGDPSCNTSLGIGIAAQRNCSS
jgi:hypothetical protein